MWWWSRKNSSAPAVSVPALLALASVMCCMAVACTLHACDLFCGECVPCVVWACPLDDVSVSCHCELTLTQLVQGKVVLVAFVLSV